MADEMTVEKAREIIKLEPGEDDKPWTKTALFYEAKGFLEAHTRSQEEMKKHISLLMTAFGFDGPTEEFDPFEMIRRSREVIRKLVKCVKDTNFPDMSDGFPAPPKYSDPEIVHILEEAKEFLGE